MPQHPGKIDRQEGLAAMDAVLGDIGDLQGQVGADLGGQPPAPDVPGEPLPVPPGATGTVIGPDGTPVTGELVEAFTPPEGAGQLPDLGVAPDVIPPDMAGLPI